MPTPGQPRSLTLRPLQPSDCDRLLTWIETEDALYQWSGARSFSWPLDRGQLLRDLAASTESQLLFAGVDDRDEMVAHVMLDFNRHHRLGLIGRVAVAPDRRGRGLGTALMQETVRQGFDDLGLHRLQLAVYTFNAAAIACYRSVGFVVEGEARDATRGSAGYWNALTMSLLEPDYRCPPGLGDGIRLAGPGDAEAVASLLTQHGYPHDRSQASDRLLAWAAESLASVLVADLDGSVAGLAAVHRQPHFERPGARPRVVALIVDADRGPAEIRRRLMDAVGRWAAARGCSEVEAAPPGLAGT
ncbi:MAG: GNAT family N-acetyltransferase [Solirubrobacteraceae bacterium]